MEILVKLTITVRDDADILGLEKEIEDSLSHLDARVESVEEI